jgi:hypothetical protein
MLAARLPLEEDVALLIAGLDHKDLEQNPTFYEQG